MRVKHLSVTILATLLLTGGHRDVVLLVGQNNQLIVKGESFTQGKVGAMDVAQVQPGRMSMKWYPPKKWLGIIPANSGVDTP
ncbi:hypothetical protein [Sulfuricella sp.]|uniref:hypothetical protein n=1 Tax=Sulfuricella sp. TaxID=2099377 RepID=UPI002CC917A6|nr:hypothetical protein [Sulfuricella sp.]HUX62221.1 hypothetical protein [Sulfuricella sp.]